MYIAYMFMMAVTVAAIYSASTSGVPTSDLEKRAEAMLYQMHYHHMAAFREFEDCMETSSCPSGEVDISDLLDEAMEDAPAYSTGRFVSFIDPAVSVSDSPLDGILVTLWVEGGANEPPYGGAAYARSAAMGNSYYMAGRAKRGSGNNYEIPIPTATDFRTPMRLDEAIFSIAGLGLNQRESYLAFYSSGVDIYQGSVP